MRGLVRFVLFSGLLVACGAPGGAAKDPQAGPVVAARELPGTDDQPHAIVDSKSKLTVLEFFSAHCPCQSEHDVRLREIALAYAPQGVTFYGVDSEVEATAIRDREMVQKRGLPFPILIDTKGAVAKSLDANYATFTVVLDHEGHVIYAGGIDSDKSHLRDDATFYLKDALDDALAGKTPRKARTEALGCALTLE